MLDALVNIMAILFKHFKEDMSFFSLIMMRIAIENTLVNFNKLLVSFTLLYVCKASINVMFRKLQLILCFHFQLNGDFKL